MTDRTTAVVAWSGGKDAVAMLYAVRQEPLEIVELFTTVNAEFDRSTIHGVRTSVLEVQSSALGIPINLIELPANPSNDIYEQRIEEVYQAYEAAGIDIVLIGDIDLGDVRAYRERRLEGRELEGRWPLWGRDTNEHARSFIEAGFKATVVAVDASYLDASFVGRPFSRAFLDDLPATVDPAGENGEFHSFVWDGPTFRRPVSIEVTDRVTREVGETTMHYADIELIDE